MAAFLEEYTLLDELGQGGYATVYKVRHNQLGYIRAIRVLNATIAHGESDKTYQKFLEECRLLLRLGNGNHPNIVHIFQPLLKAQHAIVEMDYVDGKDIYNFLQEHTSFAPIDDVLRLVSDIGSALAYCHHDIYKFCMDKEIDNLEDDPNDGSKPLITDEIKARLVEKYRVVHNDIHSGNILRREDGSYVLLDFGLAIEGNDVVRSSRRRNGAPEFKAPEKWEDDSQLSTQSDIYSFGVVLYELLTGRVPFPFDKKKVNSAEAEYLVGQAHKFETPAPIFEMRKAAFEASHPGQTYQKDYPDWLETLIMKCLAKKAEDRYKDGRKLYDFAKPHLNDSDNINVEPYKAEIDSLKKQLSTANAECNTLKAVNKELTSSSAALKENNALLQQASAKRKGSNKGWIISIILLFISTASLGYLYYDASNSKTSKVSNGNKNSVRVERLISENDKLKNENKKLKEQISNNPTSQEINNLTNELKSKEDSLSIMRMQLFNLKENNTANKEIEKLNKTISENEKRIKTLEADLKYYKSQK